MDTIDINIIATVDVTDKLRRGDEGLTAIVSDISVVDRIMVAARINIAATISPVDKMHGGITVQDTIVASIPTTSRLHMTETVLVSASISQTIRDIKVYRKQHVVYKQIEVQPTSTAYLPYLRPIEDLIRNSLSFVTPENEVGYYTSEMMLMSGAQLYNSVKDIYTRQLRIMKYKTDNITINGVAWSPSYTSTLTHSSLCVANQKSASMTLPNSSTTITYSSIHQFSLMFLGFKSGVIVPSTGSQNITYSNAKSKNRLITTNNCSDSSINYNTGVAVLEYSDIVDYKIKINSNRAFITSTIPLLTGSFNINYGGENTFYSLNGFFNYFRYRHQDIMATTYHVMLNAKLINMYTKDLVCVESHKAGYKRVSVPATFLKDINGLWLSKDTLAHIFTEDQFTLYSQLEKKLYTYDFDNISLTSKNYFNIDSDLAPVNVSLFLDPLYKMPYIMPNTSEGNQRITQPSEFWNFIQINNLKLVDNYATITEASDNYVHELFVPTTLFIDNILFRYKDTFILEGSRSAIERVIYTVDLQTPSVIKELVSYKGNSVRYAKYPVIYYSEYSSNFTNLSVFNKLVKLNLETMDFEITEVDHYSYHIVDDGNHIWHLCKKSINSAYYLFREDEPAKTINLTMYLNLGDNEILEVMVFNSYDIYILTSDRKIYTFNTQAIIVTQVTTQGLPILFIKFNSQIGCVVTRKDNYMYFEELQQVKWSTTPSDWVTPYDMRKGELLLPYLLYQSVLHKRTAPIISQMNTNVVERISNHYIELEAGLVEQMSAPMEVANVYPVKVGHCLQTIYGNTQYTDINPNTYSFGQTSYNKSLDLQSSLNEDETFNLSIDDLPIPEALVAGFKIYEK